MEYTLSMIFYVIQQFFNFLASVEVAAGVSALGVIIACVIFGAILGGIGLYVTSQNGGRSDRGNS